MAGGFAVTFSVVDNATKNIDAINRRIAAMRAPMERMSRSVQRFVDVSGLRKVATGFDWIFKAASSVLRSLTQIVPVMGAITGAASIAGMVKLVQQYSAWSRELVQAADNIGITTQKLQQFEDATRLAGGNANDMREGLKGLHDTLSNFNIGAGDFALTGQWANQLGIHLRDANGQIRTAESLMPELLKRLAEIPNPADRAAASIALLGGNGEKLVETFRQSSQSFARWFADVQRYKDLTDDQKKSLQQFGEAQGRIGVAFDRLGQQISVIVARDLGPLLERFAVFVEQNTPAILAAVDDISKRFAAWLAKPETVAAFTNGINSLIDALKFVVTHLDEIKLAAEAVAAVFVLKWAGDAVLAVRALTAAIGVGGAVAGGSLLAALASVAAIASVIALKGDTPGAGTPATPEQRKAAEDKAAEINKRQGYTGSLGEDLATWVQKGFEAAWDRISRGPENIRPGYRPQSAPGGYLPGGVTPAAYQPGGVAARPPMEFWLDMTRAVSAGFEDAFNHLRDTGGAPGAVTVTPGVVPASYTPGDRFGPNSGAPGGGVPGGGSGGLGGIDVPAGTPIAKTGLATVTSASGRRFQVDERFAANFQGFINDYEKAGGVLGPDTGTLGNRPNNASGHPIGAAIDINQIGRGVRSPRGISLDPRVEDELARKWGFVSGNQWRSNDQGHFGIQSLEAARQALINNGLRPPVAAAPPVAVPRPAPVNGSVDVNITHRNPPPNSAVTASGSGAVNVPPPRVEYQSLTTI
jgi:hypothetical protein